MPELPEVEITARLIGAAVGGCRRRIGAGARHQCAAQLRPAVGALDGGRIAGIRRRGKLFLVEFENELTALVHLMSAGRLQLFDTRASLRDRTSRLLVRLDDGRELRLREFGTKQRGLGQAVAMPARSRPRRRSPHSVPRRGPTHRRSTRCSTNRGPLYALMRDQHVIAGIGRSWVDEILHRAMISPFKRGSDLEADEAERLREARSAAAR